jgi:hypothetical protein
VISSVRPIRFCHPPVTFATIFGPRRALSRNL